MLLKNYTHWKYLTENYNPAEKWNPLKKNAENCSKSCWKMKPTEEKPPKIIVNAAEKLNHLKKTTENYNKFCWKIFNPLKKNHWKLK